MTSQIRRIAVLAVSVFVLTASFFWGANGESRSDRARFLQPPSLTPPQEQTQVQNEPDDLRPLTTSRVAALSKRIVLAKCIAVNTREAASGNIFTFSTFEALQIIKGNLPAKQFTLRFLGGRIGNVEIDASGVPKFAVGEEVVLFAGRDNQEGYPTIFPQAIFRIRTQSVTGQKIVFKNPTGIQLYRAKDHTRYSSPPESLPLEDFLYSLTKLNQ